MKRRLLKKEVLRLRQKVEYLQGGPESWTEREVVETRLIAATRLNGLLKLSLEQAEKERDEAVAEFKRHKSLDNRDYRNLYDSYVKAMEALAWAGVEPGHSMWEAIEILATERDHLRHQVDVLRRTCTPDPK